jgi:2-(1,2-epoxy-1,2-dihydrophenyl)acetyl-CoA isomerase
MSEVNVERISRTTIISLQRPEARNALTRTLIRSLTEALEAAGADPEVRVVVLTGSGGHFCAGADLRKNFESDPDLLNHLEEYMDEYHGLIRAIVRCPKPTIAMMDGAAVGFGADLTFACDLRVATTRAYIQEKFVKIGLMPDGGGTFWLPRLVGTARAMELALLGEKLEAAQMKELGLLLKLVQPEHLRESTLEVASRLEAGPPLAHAQIKSAIYASWGPLEDALRREREGQLKLLRSADAMEGIMAWMQKRDPAFQGK